MRRTAFDDRRDQEAADDHYIADRLMCRAEGCPNRWSVAEGMIGEGIRGLCSAHQWSDPMQWAAVTVEQQRRMMARGPARSHYTGADTLGCLRCGGGTPRAELSNYGGMCHGCYRLYLSGGRQQGSPISRQQCAEALEGLRGAVGGMGRGGKTWAHNLRDRELAGESLSKAQRDTWRAALQERVPQSPEVKA